MINAEKHIDFLELELEEISNKLIEKLNTSAKKLIHNNEMFISLFVKEENGEMILKMSSRNGLPRKKEFYRAIVLSKELSKYKEWNNETWGDLVNNQLNFSDTFCVWFQKLEDESKIIAGFRGVTKDFLRSLEKGCPVFLEPKREPTEFLENSIKMLKDNEFINSKEYRKITEFGCKEIVWNPILIKNEDEPVSNIIFNESKDIESLVVQGPPGTGKTYLIAEIIRNLSNLGKSILVTALTNEALIEIARKPAIKTILNQKKIFKTNLTGDEEVEIKGIQEARDNFSPIKGNVVLSTFYITSRMLFKSCGQKFDYVIIDEASQGFLSIFMMSTILGEKSIWIGDPFQLTPIVKVNEDKIIQKGYGAYVNGLETICYNLPIKSFRLTETYRLSSRGANYTGIFYENSIISKVENFNINSIEHLSYEFRRYFHNDGGPTMIKTEMEIGSKTLTDKNMTFIKKLTKEICENKSLHVAILCKFKETVKSIQKNFIDDKILTDKVKIETVDRIQGLTTDITIFIIPDALTGLSLKKGFFNVATSRAKIATIIINPKTLNESISMSPEVKKYIRTLENDNCFSI